MKKKWILLLSMALLLAVALVPATCVAEPVDTSCASYYVADYNSGTELYAENADERREIASMVKIMTANLVLEAIERGELSLDDEITISQTAAHMGGSQMFLDAGAAYQVGDLLKGVIVVSANDAAVALAERVAGSHEGFVSAMNARAAELGMENTKYVNATGLPSEQEQYSTARDVNIVTRQLMSHDLYFSFASIWLEDYVHPSGRVTQLANTNKLLKWYEGCKGGKTGYTDRAGYCLSACAERGGMRVVATVTGAKESKGRFRKVMQLFDSAFGEYKNQVICRSGETLELRLSVAGSPVSDIALTPAEDLTMLVKSGEKGVVEYRLPDSVKAPVRKGDIVGEAIVRVGEKERVIPVAAAEDARKSTFADWLRKIVEKW